MRRRRVPQSKPDNPAVFGKAKQIAAHLGAADVRRLRNWCDDRAHIVASRERAALGERRLAELAKKKQGRDGERLMLSLCVALTSRVYQPGEAVVFQVKRGRKHRGLWITNDRMKQQVRRNRGWVWVPLRDVPDFVDYEPNTREANAAEGQKKGEALSRLFQP